MITMGTQSWPMPNSVRAGERVQRTVADGAAIGQVRYTAAEFITLADKFHQAATLLMCGEQKLGGDDPLVIDFMRYAEMCRQAAKTERER